MFVYLDTNVYWAAKFVFNKDKFGTLTKYIIEGKVQVLYTSSTIKEVLKHLEEEIKKEVGVYNRSIRKNLSAYRIEEELGIHQLEADRIINFRKKTLCDFLDLHGVEQISLNPIDAELLMEDYFSVKPPFETQN